MVRNLTALKKICAVDREYVGLLTVSCVADLGNVVTSVDIGQERIADPKQGEVHS